MSWMNRRSMIVWYALPPEEREEFLEYKRVSLGDRYSPPPPAPTDPLFKEEVTEYAQVHYQQKYKEREELNRRLKAEDEAMMIALSTTKPKDVDKEGGKTRKPKKAGKNAKGKGKKNVAKTSQKGTGRVVGRTRKPKDPVPTVKNGTVKGQKRVSPASTTKKGKKAKGRAIESTATHSYFLRNRNTDLTVKKK